MMKYDQNTGHTPRLGDRVEFCYTASDMDSLTGRVGGWGDPSKYIVLVILDVCYTDGTEVVGMPVVCCRLLK